MDGLKELNGMLNDLGKVLKSSNASLLIDHSHALFF